MEVIPARVRNGTIDVAGLDLPDGSCVGLLIPSDRGAVCIEDPELEKALLRSIEQAERGEFIDAGTFLETLEAKRSTMVDR